jgi:ParB-like chromosome segregation protein Spo0J
MTPTIITLKLTEVKPYWRNPRENHEAVQKLKQSILEYGYNQLLLVDRKNVIIAGHTRYLALKELALVDPQYAEISVQVLDLPERQAKAYRIVDNKAAEFATWKQDALKEELKELGRDLPTLQGFFLESLSNLDAPILEPLTAPKSDFGYGSAVHKQQNKEVACPECGETFYLQGDSA